MTYRFWLVFFLFFSGICIPACTQTDLNTQDPEFIYKTGAGNATVHTSWGSAMKDGRNCQKMKISWEYLGKKIKKINKLTGLQIALLDNNGITELPATMGELSQLFIFSSKSNPIRFIDPAIGRQQSLMILELTGTKLDSLPAEFCDMQNLELLRIMQNESKDTLQLPDDFFKMRSLRTLQIVKADVYKFHANIYEAGRLEKLTCSSCKLSYLPDSIGYASGLVHLDLSDNTLQELPASIGYLKKLQYLSLQNNKLNTLPYTLSYLSNLQTLDVRGNMISREELDILRLSLPRCRVLFDVEKK
ncbi:MAG: leucine-rich repeat domain-containing protein [Bacteroidia bacterium]|nr:leucine-rich repeat domain-containing protein [Bacteroidia bacterium]